MRVGAGRETIDLQESWHGLERAGFDCGVGFSWRFRWIRRECVRKACAQAAEGAPREEERQPVRLPGGKEEQKPLCLPGQKADEALVVSKG